jgi:myo-inositol catabolism protein IolS
MKSGIESAVYIYQYTHTRTSIPLEIFIIVIIMALNLSNIGFGCWQLGSKGEEDYWGLKYTDELAIDLVGCAVKNGITYMDTAEAYSAGNSEKQLKVALSKLSKEDRDTVVIGSKILPNHCDDVRKYTEDTLERLGEECIDLYMVHWPLNNENGIVAKAFKDLMELQKEGKIKHIGVSNFGVAQLKEAMATGVKIAVNQLCYNLIFRSIEFEILPFCIQNSIQVTCYSPLMQGILTGRYSTADEIPLVRRRSRHFDCKTNEKSRHGEDGHENTLFETLGKLVDYSKKINIPLSDLAIAYPLHKKGITSVIVGATKKEQVLSNANAGSLKLDEAIIKQLDEITDPLKVAMKSNADLWQGVVDGVQTGRIK